MRHKHNNKITFFWLFFIYSVFTIKYFQRKSERKARLTDIDAETQLSTVLVVWLAFTFSPLSDDDLYVGKARRVRVDGEEKMNKNVPNDVGERQMFSAFLAKRDCNAFQRVTFHSFQMTTNVGKHSHDVQVVRFIRLHYLRRYLCFNTFTTLTNNDQAPRPKNIIFFYYFICDS